MKAKSMKLRTLITLHALWKHTDENHRLNTIKLNKYLKPYGLECNGRVLTDTVRVLKGYGFDVQSKGEWDNQGVWLADRPLKDDVLDKLIFAVQSNPYLPKEQEKEILTALMPLVTAYQEEKLSQSIIASDKLSSNADIYHIYSVIQEAIRKRRRIVYNVEYVQYNKENNLPECRVDVGTLFTPKCIFQAKERLYMFGYNHPDKKLEAVPLESIVGIKLSFKHNSENATITQKVDQLFQTVDPRDYITEERQDIIYSGSVVFYCRGQYVEEIYRRFGEPSGPIRKNTRCMAFYPVESAKLTPESLVLLATVPNFGVRVGGPEEAVKAVQDYYSNTASNITENWQVLNRRTADK